MKISIIIKELKITQKKYGDVDAMVFVNTPRKTELPIIGECEAFRLQRAHLEVDGKIKNAILIIEYTDDIDSAMSKPSISEKINKQESA